MAVDRGLRLARLELAGFRGIREPTRLALPPGFVVITGRNGSGKSSICDAIEYALLGELHKYDEGKEVGESINDYVWWRGEPVAEEQFVRLTLSATDGRGKEVISRSADRRRDRGVENLAAALCLEKLAPADCLGEICRSALIRDEMIAAESVDLAQAQRYEFVRAAAGIYSLAGVDRRSNQVHQALLKKKDAAEEDFEDRKEELARLRTELTELREEAAGIADVDAAERALAKLVGTDETAASLAQSARRLAGELRTEIKEISELASQAGKLRAEMRQRDSKQSRLARQQLESELDLVKRQLPGLRQEFEDSNRLWEEAETAAVGRSLDALRRHGKKVGLQERCCPLCGQAQTEEEFEKALEVLNDKVAADAGTRADLEQRAEEARKELRALERRERRLDEELGLFWDRGDELESKLKEIRARAKEEIGLRLSPDLLAEEFDDAINERRSTRREVETELGILDASLVVDKVRALEDRARSAEQARDRARSLLTRLESALQRFNTYWGGIKRAVGEQVSERLGLLEPLLGNLYLRLRPHLDWEEIHYRLGGQVRRVLNLEVGEALNPRFMFSSGQRRAAGLSFLLAVYLSRSWCRLQTLILDDPVQHIDDYRSLHLVETLAAIRRAGHQVICTVEDHDLAELMARRLCTGPDPVGLLVEMRYRPRRGAEFAEIRKIEPPTASILVDRTPEED